MRAEKTPDAGSYGGIDGRTPPAKPEPPFLHFGDKGNEGLDHRSVAFSEPHDGGIHDDVVEDDVADAVAGNRQIGLRDDGGADPLTHVFDDEAQGRKLDDGLRSEAECIVDHVGRVMTALEDHEVAMTQDVHVELSVRGDAGRVSGSKEYGRTASDRLHHDRRIEPHAESDAHHHVDRTFGQALCKRSGRRLFGNDRE